MDLTERLQKLCLETLDKEQSIPDSTMLTLDNQSIDQSVLTGVLKSLETREMVSFETKETEKWILTEEGQDIAKNGSHEVKVFNLVTEEGTPIESVEAALGAEVTKIGQAKAFKNKWIDRKNGGLLYRKVDDVVDETRKSLVDISERGTGSEDTLKDLKKRKLIDRQKVISHMISKGSHFATQVERLHTDLTAEMLASKSWEAAKFKNYNFDAMGLPPSAGHLHPLLKVREEFRQIFFEMGFIEMPTNQYVDSSFWNFDTLFQPQQHPARDAHDTFFLTNPEQCHRLPDADYVERTKEMHQEGGYGSIGYNCEWKLEETRKNLLRTHTTAVSSRMLYELAQQETFTPKKYFSIDKVFRNETVDATHLAEFHQVEGLVADYDLTLGDLTGLLMKFFSKLGLNRLRFKPAYNPYTEPSMEVFAFHEGLNKWVEVGNSGMFRPEMLRPMGFDERVSVIAWGLSLERPTMIKYNVSNIRDLVGHKVDLAMVQSNPICRLDKH